MTPAYLIGIDGGGSGTRAVAYAAEGVLLGRAQAGPAALGRGAEAAWRAIDTVVENALLPTGLSFDRSACALGVGLAGANHAPWRAQFLAADPGYAATNVETDGFAWLLGAHAGGPGALVAMGTGSMGECWQANGTRRSVGGWGFPTGDEGSGSWLGLHAVRHTQQVLDGLRPASGLSDVLLRQLGGSREALLAFVVEADATALAQLAPLVFAQAPHDDIAAEMLDEAASELRAMMDALDPDAALRMTVAGSVATRLLPRLPETTRPLHPPLLDAAQGALLGLCRALRHLPCPQEIRAAGCSRAM